MPVRRRITIPAVCRRATFWLTVSLAGNAIVWLLIRGHQASLSLAAPQSLYGISISHDVSMGLVLLELAGVPFFGLMLPASLVWCLVSRFRRVPTPGLCSVCGYDLRATPTQCPECGTYTAGQTTAR